MAAPSGKRGRVTQQPESRGRSDRRRKKCFPGPARRAAEFAPAFRVRRGATPKARVTPRRRRGRARVRDHVRRSSARVRSPARGRHERPRDRGKPRGRWNKSHPTPTERVRRVLGRAPGFLRRGRQHLLQRGGSDQTREEPRRLLLRRERARRQPVESPGAGAPRPDPSHKVTYYGEASRRAGSVGSQGSGDHRDHRDRPRSPSRPARESRDARHAPNSNRTIIIHRTVARPLALRRGSAGVGPRRGRHKIHPGGRDGSETSRGTTRPATLYREASAQTEVADLRDDNPTRSSSFRRRYRLNFAKCRRRWRRRRCARNRPNASAIDWPRTSRRRRARTWSRPRRARRRLSRAVPRARASPGPSRRRRWTRR